MDVTAGTSGRDRNLADGLAGLLRQYPDALVLALNGEGLGVPVPPSVPLNGQRVAEVATGLDLVAPDDFPLIIDAWRRTIELGAASVDARLRNGAIARVRNFDVRATHGCLISVVVESQGDDAAAAEVVIVPVRASVCRTRKTELGIFLEADQAAEEMYGVSASKMVGLSATDFIHRDDVALSVDSWMRMLMAPGSTVRCRVRQIRLDGSELWVDLTNHNRLDETEGCVVSDVVDVTQEVNIQRELAAQHRLLRRVTEAMPSGLLHVDVDQRVVHANDHLLAILGTRPAGQAADLFGAVVDDDRDLVLEAVAAACAAGLDADLEVRLMTATPDAAGVCALAIRALVDDNGLVGGAVVSATDVTEAARRRADLEIKASFDPLTGCYNRDSIMAALELAVLAEPVSGTAVLFIDLDHFKSINDTLGHAAGDLLLCAVADRLNRTIRTGDLVGRIGGDEFLVVCPHVAAADVATTVGRRLLDALRQPLELDGEPIQPSASIGIAWVDGAAAPTALVAAADAAMYRAKRDDQAQPVLVQVGNGAGIT